MNGRIVLASNAERIRVVSARTAPQRVRHATAGWALWLVYRPDGSRSGLDRSLFAFSSIASRTFSMSAGDNCGRSTLIVSLLSLAASGNGSL
jgi:hypothetical protein